MECLNFGDGKFSLMSPLYQNQSDSILDEVYIEDLDGSNLMRKSCLFDLEYNIEDHDDGWNIDLSTGRINADSFLADSGSDWSCSVNSTQDTCIDTNPTTNDKTESVNFTTQESDLSVFGQRKGYYEFLGITDSRQVPAEIMKPEKKPAYIRNLDISNLKRICEKAKVDNTYLDPASFPLNQLVKPTDVLNVTVKSESEPDLLMDTSFDLLGKELDIDKLDLNEPDGDFDLTSYITGDWEGNLDVDAVLSEPSSPIRKSPLKNFQGKRGSPIRTRKRSKSPVLKKTPIKSSPIQIKKSSPIPIEKRCSSPIRIRKCESDDDIDVETVSPSDVQPILQATDVTSLLEQFEANEVVNETVNKKKSKKVKPVPKKIKKKVECFNPLVRKNSVIGPVSNSKPISYDDDKKIIRKRNSKTLRDTQKSIYLDHDYCAVDPKSQPPPRESSKQPADYYKVLRRTEIVWGQGIASKGIRCTEPDTPPKKPEDTSIRIKVKPIEIKPEDTSLSIETQPKRSIINSPLKIKKFKESKLVSVLKSKASMEVTSNTVIATTNEQDQMPKKRKLNLEEYKKLRSCEPSRTNSPSGSSSPVTPISTANEMSPAERLLEMAAKVLATKPSETVLKCELQPFIPPGTVVEEVPKPVEIKEVKRPINDKYEMKTFVSIGINTDITVIQTTRLLNNQKQAKLKADQKIKELITPILQNAGSKINSNSLISNIKDTMLQKVKPIIPPVAIVQEEKSLEHGENKVVVHLEKNRVKVGMVTMETQTEQWEFENETKSRRKNRQYRKRSDSNSSSSSVETTTSKNSRGKHSYHSKKSSNSLEFSNWSRQSRSRSRSLSEHSRSSYSSSSSCSSRRSSSSCSSSQRSYSGRYYKRGRRSRHSQSSYGSYNRRSRRSSRDKKLTEQEHMRQIEERRVIYVGRLLPGTTKHDLRRRFNRFGPITDTSVHFREQGDNYGFVTFEYKQDAFEAIEKGNDDPNLPEYDISFGGRRAFCQTRYADLDNSEAIETGGYSVMRPTGHQEESFESLLQQFQAKLRKRQV